MKTKRFFIALTLLALSTLNSQLSTAHAQGTAFTYQGRLNNGTNPATGSYDLTFTLFNVSSGGSAVAGPLTNSATGVSNGLFLATLDFGGVFNGADYWLEIGVRTNGNGAFTTLAPRQAVTPTPYAIFAEGASNVVGVVPSGGLNGSYSSAVSFNNAGNSFNGSFSGNGSSLTGVNAAALDGLGAAGFWQTTGNAGTTPGANFVGTTDNQPLELHVNSQRALRLELTSPDGPNIIGGYSNNFVGAGISSATIAGGGLSGLTNRITGLGYGGAIGGGRNNWVNNFNGAVSGGANNTAFENATSIGGGSENYAGGDHDTIGGGQNNTNYGDHATIGGGANNSIIGAADHASISGGGGNTIIGSAALPVYDTISGGANNLIQTNTSCATISGGQNNAIQSYTSDTFIGGGQANNAIGSDATIGGGNGNSANYLSTVGGGAKNAANGLGAVVAGGGIWVSNSFLYNVGNTAYGNSSAVGGGALNYAAGGYASIGGGYQNTAGVPQYGSGNSPVVAGGYQNTASADFSAVSGGSNNVASGVASTIGGGLNNSTTNAYATVAGGYQNTAGGSSGYATVGGGYQNNAGGTYGTVSGGANNTASGSYTVANGGFFNTASATGATVPGGVGNVASGAGSFAAGQDAAANNSGSFVWSDGSVTTTSTANNQFMARASGGFVFYTSSGTSGAQLPAGSGSWSSLSDRNAKNEFAPVNSQSVLAQVASLPLTTWSYKTEPGVRHVGPMAQDFYATFGVGEDERHIATVDEEGVALAAIQGLNQKLESEAKTKDAEIQQLRQSISQLQATVAQLAKSQPK